MLSPRSEAQPDGMADSIPNRVNRYEPLVVASARVADMGDFPISPRGSPPRTYRLL